MNHNICNLRTAFFASLFFTLLILSCDKPVPAPETNKGAEPAPENEFIGFEQKAATDNAVAQYKFGNAYYYGEGVPEDIKKAIGWYQKAAKQGNADAQFSLGQIYFFGNDVPKSMDKAVYWFQKSATQGNAAAQRELGLCYALGDGVPQDTILSLAWINLSLAKFQDKRLYDISCSIERNMTLPQIAEARRLSSSWVKGTILQREDVSSNASSTPVGVIKK